jgi:hypothetical protein
MSRTLIKREPKEFRDNGSISGIMLKLFLYSQEESSKEQEHKKHKRYLDKEKVYVLNKYVFPSMVRLTYFFKYVSTYKSLDKIFENDIKDLLGIRVKDPESDDYAFIFSDLIRSILSMDFYEKDFRLGLIQILQEIIREKVEDYLTHTHEKTTLTRVIIDDFDRVSAWTEMIAESISQAAEDKVRPHRTISFRHRLSLPGGEKSI